MCSNTKQRIADAVEELISTQPGSRVTVQQVMELTQMNRRSFYYHYEDINDVLRLIVCQKVCAPLAFDPEENAETWCRRGLTLLSEQQPLLRRISRELGDERMRELILLEVRPQVERLVPDRPGQDRAQRSVAVDVVCQSVLFCLHGMLLRQEPVNVDDSMERFQALFAVLNVA